MRSRHEEGGCYEDGNDMDQVKKGDRKGPRPPNTSVFSLSYCFTCSC